MRNINTKFSKFLLMPAVVMNLNVAAFDSLPQPDEPPAYLKLIEHFHLEKNMNQNPGFYKSTGVDTAMTLQGCLDKELAVSKKRYEKNFGIALVDLSGKKLEKPEYAGYNSTIAMYGASQSKMGALLAIHQLRYDIEKLGQKLASEKTGAEPFLMEELIAAARSSFGGGNSLFKIKDKFSFSGSGKDIKVQLSEKMKKELIQMMRISNNYVASVVIKKIGFNYINSVLWQSGIYDKNRGGGLWVGRAYAGGKFWHRDPVAKLSHGTNSLSMVKYMTLLEQGRLVSPKDSESIKYFLSDTRFRIKFVRGIMDLGLKVNNYAKAVKDPTRKATIWRKSGTMKGSHRISHDAILVERQVCKDKECNNKVLLRYAAAGVSQYAAVRGMRLWGKQLDRCIQKNNGI